MKKKLLILGITLTLLSGCGFINNNPLTSESDSDVILPSEEEESESESYFGPAKPQEGYIDMYAINDFHGAVVEQGYEMGIQRVGTFLKKKRQNDNTLLINTGDMWQGSIESNYSHGEMLSRITNEIEFDSFVIGNHEFDWGDKYIKHNRDLVDEDSGYSTPYLAANIYNYDIKTKTRGSFANLGKKYVVRELENGIRVGIIGMIGSSQITSITSSNVDHYEFVSPISLIPSLADELRNKQGCNIVVAAIHNGSETATSSFVKHVDALFVSHTHKKESLVVNGVPVIQGGNNGRYISNIKLHLALDGTVTTETRVNLLNADIPYESDTGIQKIIDEYKPYYEPIGSEIVGNTNAQLGKNEHIPNMVCTALADYAYEKNIDIDYAVVNGGRDNISSGNFTYANLFKALPFDNEVFIANVSGSDLINQLDYNNFYRLDDAAFSESKTYKIAVIDYLATHRNSGRDYDKFPSLQIIDSYKLDGYELFNYRDATYEWLKDLSTNNININASDFSSSNSRHNSSELYYSQSFAANKYIF